MSRPIHTNRVLQRTSAKRLRRARRLYVFLARHALQTSTDNTVIHQMGKRMFESGLYAPTPNICWRDFRYRIVRRLYRIDCQTNPSAGEWHFWHRRNGWDHNFNRNLRIQQSA